MVETQHEMAGLDAKIFKTKKIVGGLVHLCRVPNGCVWPVLRAERSRSWVLDAISINAASLAQSKCAGIEVECGATELAGGEAGDRGHETVAVGVEDLLSAVKDVGSARRTLSEALRTCTNTCKHI
jgi:hypothetical protein